MTNISLEESGTDIRITCAGHAGYGRPGEDIVCAAVSVMCQTFGRLCCDSEEKIEIKEFYSEHGMFRVWISDPDGCLLSAVKMLKIAFEGLSEEYPENVHLTLGRN